MSSISSIVPPGVTGGDRLLPGSSAEIAPDSLYHTLPTPLSFRLIKIVAVFPYLKCEMKTVSPDEHPPLYQAPSYCWGSPDRSVTLRCNGFKLGISTNLAEGLRKLHAYSGKMRWEKHSAEARWDKSRWFWVDQICINQEDNAERTQQVRIMRSIYKRSTHTIVWLPIKNEIAKAAKSMVTDMSYQHPDTPLPSENDKRWSALAQVLESPWFERCWILQEMAVSRRCPDILCGNQRFLWSDFERAIYFLDKFRSKHPTERMEFVNSIHEVIGRHNWHYLRQENTVSHLHVLLRLTSSFRSTDPRDKVFALLGLSSASRDPENWPEEVAPDYTRTMFEVYAGATKYCIRQTGSSSILSQFVHNKLAGATSPYIYLPSWVPRWDLADSTRRINAFSLHQDPDETRILKEKPHEASMDTGVEMDQNTPLGVLRLLGMQVDTVNVCLPTVMLDDTKFHAGVPERYRDYLSDLLPRLYRMCEKHVKHVTYSFDFTFFRVTTAGLAPWYWDLRLSAPSDAQRDFESIVNPPQEGSAKGQTPLSNTEDWSPKHSTESSLPSPRSSRGQYQNCYIALLKRLMNRRLFITSSERLGLGPAGMMSGDTVAILFGGNVPYILRPSEDNRWQFVGECYLDGYMNGQAMEGRDPSRDEWFELV